MIKCHTLKIFAGYHFRASMWDIWIGWIWYRGKQQNVEHNAIIGIFLTQGWLLSTLSVTSLVYLDYNCIWFFFFLNECEENIICWRKLWHFKNIIFQVHINNRTSYKSALVGQDVVKFINIYFPLDMWRIQTNNYSGWLPQGRLTVLSCLPAASKATKH